MHRFAINDIGQRWTSIPGTTFGYYDVQLPDHAVPGHAVVNVTDVGDNDAFRAHIVGFLNTIVEGNGRGQRDRGLVGPGWGAYAADVYRLTPVTPAAACRPRELMRVELSSRSWAPKGTLRAWTG